MKKYLVRDNTRAVAALLRDWGAIILVCWLNILYPSIYLYLVSVWIIGAFQFALSEPLLHEAAHHNLFVRKKLNHRMQFLYAYPFFRTVSQFRTEHFTHHSRLGTEQDHLVADYRRMGLSGKKTNLFFIWFIKPVIGFAALNYLRTISLKPFRKDGWKIVVFWVIILAVFISLGKIIWVVKFWLVPMVWCSYSYLYWSEISDHYNTVTGTRSNFNPITNFVTHNNGYHFIHHKYPTIPWFRLKRAYRELTPGEGDISKGFLDTYRQMSVNRGKPANE
jgi:fatty acid desaturase